MGPISARSPARERLFAASEPFAATLCTELALESRKYQERRQRVAVTGVAIAAATLVAEVTVRVSDNGAYSDG